VTILLLAGTGEARILATALAQAGVTAIASFAGATRNPAVMDLPVHTGGFGSAQGFSNYLKAHAIDRILDATHPFAHRISARSAATAATLGIDYLQLLRPPWSPQEGDNWTFLTNERAAADHIPKGATVFLATGRQTLDRFSNLTGRHLICRQIDPPDHPFPFANGAFLVGRPPFSVTDEITLFQRLGVDWLVVKNAGGSASATKLEAARSLGIKVAMIERPPQPDCARVATVEEAMAWVMT